MSLDLYVHTEVNVGVFLPGGHGGVLHWVQIHTIYICRQGGTKKKLKEEHMSSILNSFPVRTE